MFRADSNFFPRSIFLDLRSGAFDQETMDVMEFSNLKVRKKSPLKTPQTLRIISDTNNVFAS
jgi:hypothetical protein